VAIAAATYLAVCVVVFLARNRMVIPVRGGPAPAGLEPVDTNGILGWFSPGERGALLWFHGNAETVAGLLPVMQLFRPQGVALLALDYRGTVDQAITDAEAALGWLRSRGYRRVVVYGRSVGTGPAVHIAARGEVDGLVLESAYTSLRDLARRHYPFLPSFLAPAAFDNRRLMPRLTCPVLFVHGAADRLIPIDMARELESLTSNRAGFLVIPGADHNDTYDLGGERYERSVRDFVAARVGSAP
jgi:pimeloyl-ACP methyl ester carboxylesterase